MFGFSKPFLINLLFMPFINMLKYIVNQLIINPPA